MSTNGIVIVKDGDDIYCKVIAGCSGQAAPELVKALAGSGANTLQAIYDLARHIDFGCRKCLVVMNSSEAIHEDGEELPQRYWDAYWLVSVNPIDPQGNVGWDYCEVVQVRQIMQAVTS